jgi:hypothetical protein
MVVAFFRQLVARLPGFPPRAGQRPSGWLFNRHDHATTPEANWVSTVSHSSPSTPRSLRTPGLLCRRSFHPLIERDLDKFNN